jgi:energy-coupling factor transporter ATP-binding protein EcfA2
VEKPMIIVEGPDGAGKTTLIQQLAGDLDLTTAGKFVKSSGEGSGTNDLFGEAYKDVVTMLDKPAMIYDRHPLISEYIYGPIVRGVVPPDFLSPQAHATMRMFEDQVHVVWCLPSLQTCMDNVIDYSPTAPEQMNGVDENIRAIWSMYHSMRLWWHGASSNVYDYTVPADAESRFSYNNVKLGVTLHRNFHNSRSKR